MKRLLWSCAPWWCSRRRSRRSPSRRRSRRRLCLDVPEGRDPRKRRVRARRRAAPHRARHVQGPRHRLERSGRAGEFSPDGKSIAFSGGVVPASGGKVTPGGPLWRPAGSTNASITAKGGLLIGATGSSRTAGARSRRRGRRRATWSSRGRTGKRSQLWFWFQDTGNLLSVAPLKNTRHAHLVGVSADGSWAFWWKRVERTPGRCRSTRSALRAEGGRAGHAVVPRPRTASPGAAGARRRLGRLEGRDRRQVARRRIAPELPGEAARHRPTRSWASPTCSADGQILVNAQPAGHRAALGRSGRST